MAGGDILAKTLIERIRQMRLIADRITCVCQLITFDQVLSIATHLLSFCLSHLTTCGSRCIAPGPASPPDLLVLTNANMCFA